MDPDLNDSDEETSQRSFDPREQSELQPFVPSRGSSPYIKRRNEKAICFISKYFDDSEKITAYLCSKVLPQAFGNQDTSFGDEEILNTTGLALTEEANRVNEEVASLIKKQSHSPWKLVQGNEPRQQLEKLYSKAQVFEQAACWLDGQPQDMWPELRVGTSEKGTRVEDSSSPVLLSYTSRPGLSRLGVSRWLRDVFQLDTPLSKMMSKLGSNPEQVESIKLERQTLRRDLSLPSWDDDEEGPLPAESSEVNEGIAVATDGSSAADTDNASDILPAIASLNIGGTSDTGTGSEK